MNTQRIFGIAMIFLASVPCQARLGLWENFNPGDHASLVSRGWVKTGEGINLFAQDASDRGETDGHEMLILAENPLGLEAFSTRYTKEFTLRSGAYDRVMKVSGWVRTHAENSMGERLSGTAHVSQARLSVDGDLVQTTNVSNVGGWSRFLMRYLGPVTSRVSLSVGADHPRGMGAVRAETRFDDLLIRVFDYPMRETYGLYGKDPFTGDMGGRWIKTRAYDPGTLDSVENAADGYATALIMAGTGAQEATVFDDDTLDGLGTYTGSLGQYATIRLRFQPDGPSQNSLWIGWWHSLQGAPSYQEGVVLRAEGGNPANTTILDNNTGSVLLTGVNFTQFHDLYFVVNAGGMIDFYLDDTGTPVAGLARTLSYPVMVVNRFRFGSNALQAPGGVKFSGQVDVSRFAIGDQFPPCSGDEDGDGICDEFESESASPVSASQTNRYLSDSDGDGLQDGVEDVNLNGFRDTGELNPRNRDTDGDGYEDGIEVLLLASDPQNPGNPGEAFMDADGDRLPDGIDPDPMDPDADGDRYLDGYEGAHLDLSAVLEPLVFPSLGDVNQDGSLDNADSQLTLNFFGRQPVVPGFTPGTADVNRDAFIDNADSQEQLNFFGRQRDTYPIE